MADGLEHIRARVGFLEIGRTTGGFGFTASGGIVMGSDKNEGRRAAISLKPLSQLNPRHTLELNIQNKAVEARLLCIREKCFGRRIGNRLKASGPQQPAKGPAHSFIVINDGDISLFSADHRKVAVILGLGVKCRLLSFGEGRSVLSEYFSFEREPGKFRDGRYT